MVNCYWVLADKVLILVLIFEQNLTTFGIPHKLN